MDMDDIWCFVDDQSIHGSMCGSEWRQILPESTCGSAMHSAAFPH